MDSCPACGTALSSPLVCEACHELLDPGAAVASPFAIFGLEPGIAVDTKALRKRLLRLSRELHPDFHGAAEDDVRALAESNSAELNAAFEVLSDLERRADWLVRELGGPAAEEERQMPQEFLMDVLDWNTAVEDARGAEPGSPEREELSALRAQLEEAREERRESLLETFDPLPEPGSDQVTRARRQLNALRYLARTLREIEELELAFQRST